MVSDEVDPEWPPPEDQPSDDVDTSAQSRQRSVWLLAASAVLVAVGAVAVGALWAQNRAGPSANSSPPTTIASTPPTPQTPVPPTSTAANAPVTQCGPDEATAVAATVAGLPPDMKTGEPWNSTPESSNYDPCADLSAVVVTVRDATRSSPDQALLFHRGEFVGTATPKAYPFTALEGPASTNDIVVLTYRTGQSCDACKDGSLTIVGFRWQGDRVHMLDEPPQTVDSP